MRWVHVSVFMFRPLMLTRLNKVCPSIRAHYVDSGNSTDGVALSPSDAPGSNLDWGLAKWAPYFMDLMQDVAVDVAHFQGAQILGDRYHRVQPVLPRKVELDDPGEVAFLAEVAGSKEVQGMVEEAAEWVGRRLLRSAVPLRGK